MTSVKLFHLLQIGVYLQADFYHFFDILPEKLDQSNHRIKFYKKQKGINSVYGVKCERTRDSEEKKNFGVAF